MALNDNLTFRLRIIADDRIYNCKLLQQVSHSSAQMLYVSVIHTSSSGLAILA